MTSADASVDVRRDLFFANVRMTPDQAAEFARRLANDDGFRSQLEATPEEALAGYGIEVPRGLIEHPVKLPSKETMVKALEIVEGEDPLLFWVFLVFVSFLAFFSG
jgi:hypothetical protein